MSLGVADIERWNSESVREVFHAAKERAQITAGVSQGLGALGVFNSWEGEAAKAAHHAIARTRKDLDTHGAEVAGVAHAAAIAADGIDKVKADLRRVKNEAESHGVDIDPVGGVVAAIPHSTHGRREQQEWIPRITAKLAEVIDEANQVDAELAAAINMADGDLVIPLTPGGRAPGSPARTSDAPSNLPHSAPAPQPGHQPADLNDALNQIAGAPVPAAVAPPQLNPADVDAFKASARQVLAADGVPSEQIEARLSAIVAQVEQHGLAPNFVPRESPRQPAPGFGEGVGDRFRSTEQGLKNLLGQGGPGAPSVLKSWAGLIEGTGQVVANPLGAAMGELKAAMAAPSPAYYAGEKAFDIGSAAATLPFGGEGAAVRAGLPAELVTEGGAPLAVMRGWGPLGGMAPGEFEARFGTPESRVWPANEGFPAEHVPQPAHLPEGTIIDRFGSEYGRYLSPDGTPYGDRAITPETVGGDYNRYMVTGKPLPPGWQIVEGPVEPWFGQTPSPEATQYMITAPGGTTPTTRELVRLGILDEYGPPLGR